MSSDIDRILDRWAGVLAELAKGPEGYGPHAVEAVCAGLDKALTELTAARARVAELEAALTNAHDQIDALTVSGIEVLQLYTAIEVLQLCTAQPTDDLRVVASVVDRALRTSGAELLRARIADLESTPGPHVPPDALDTGFDAAADLPWGDDDPDPQVPTGDPDSA